MKRILSCFLLIACFSVNAAPANAVYTEDKTAIIVSSDHPEFVIKLKSNPSTGYSWYLRKYNSHLIQPVKRVFEAPSDKKLIGAPGYELWTFNMKSQAFIVPHQTLMYFVYARPWESSKSATKLKFRIST